MTHWQGQCELCAGNWTVLRRKYELGACIANVYVGLVGCLERFYARDELWKFEFNFETVDVVIEDPYLHLLKQWDIQSRHEVVQEPPGAMKLQRGESGEDNTCEWGWMLPCWQWEIPCGFHFDVQRSEAFHRREASSHFLCSELHEMRNIPKLNIDKVMGRQKQLRYLSLKSNAVQAERLETWGRPAQEGIR